MLCDGAYRREKQRAGLAAEDKDGCCWLGQRPVQVDWKGLTVKVPEKLEDLGKSGVTY